MNLLIFRQNMEDNTHGAEFYANFIESHEARFETIMGIVFSNKRYLGIDVKSYFYRNFHEFILKELDCNPPTNISFGEWVGNVAERKAWDARHAVNEELIRVMTSKGGRDNWSDAYDLIVSEYAPIFWRVTFQCFKDSKYKHRKAEIFHIIQNLFYLSRGNKETKAVVIHKTFEDWLFTCLKNLANNSRKKIDMELAIGHYDNPVDNEHAYGQEEEGSLMPLTTLDREPGSMKQIAGEYAEIDPGEPEEEVSLDEAPLFRINDEGEINAMDDDDENSGDSQAQDDRGKWNGGSYESRKLKEYIRKINNKLYARILHLLYFEGMSTNEAAKEIALSDGKKIENIRNEVVRATTSLVMVALPDIQEEFRNLLPYYGACLDSRQKALSNDYANGMNIPDIARRHGMTVYQVKKDLALAFKKLAKE